MEQNCRQSPPVTLINLNKSQRNHYRNFIQSSNSREELKCNEIEGKKTRVVLLFGPSQSGKSTFINTFLDYSNSALKRAQVGAGRGESVTLDVTSYEINTLPELFPNDRGDYDTIKMLDVPGSFDSGLRISDKELILKIEKELFEIGIKEIDAILVFESMKNDTRKLLLTTQKLSKVFGMSVTKSIIVLSTKWDTIEEEELKDKEDYLEVLLRKLNVKTLKWRNNCRAVTLTNEDIQTQISHLGQIIKTVNPYLVDGMEELFRVRNKLAEEIRESDVQF